MDLGKLKAFASRAIEELIIRQERDPQLKTQNLSAMFNMEAKVFSVTSEYKRKPKEGYTPFRSNP